MHSKDAMQILDLVDSGAMMLDRDQNIVFWNNFLSKTSNVSFDSAVGKNWADVFPELKGTRINKAIDRAVNLNFPSILSYKLLKKQFPLYKKSMATKPPYLIMQSIVIKPLFENKESKGCIIYINDVSATAKREDELNKQSLELYEAIHSYREMKSQFEQVFEYAHNAIIVFDKKGCIINTNNATAELFKREKSVLNNTDIAELLPDLKNHYYNQQQQNYTYSDDIDHEFEQEIKAPSTKNLSVSVSQMENDTEEEQNFFVFITDITEKKQAEEDLLNANSELEEFAYRTSHDLRSPIVSSLGLMKVATESLDSGDSTKVQACLQHASKSLSKLETLIQDILKLTEAQNKGEDDQDINIQSIVDQTFNNICQLSGFEKIQKQMDIQNHNVVRAKPTRFTMIIENLISNSIKYHDPDTDKPYVRINTYLEGSDFILDVSDNGLGIPENQHHKLFKMFNRFHPKAAFGSGLGLYLIKKSATALGGDIQYIPQTKGACFRLTIPQPSQIH